MKRTIKYMKGLTLNIYAVPEHMMSKQPTAHERMIITQNTVPEHTNCTQPTVPQHMNRTQKYLSA